MTKEPPQSRKRGTRAFSMVEVALALGIATYVLLSLLGLLNIGLATQQSSAQQTAAIDIATAVVLDLRQVPKDASVVASPQYEIDVTQAQTICYADATGTPVPSPEKALYRITVTLSPPPAGSRRSTGGTVKVSWPAMAEESVGSESVFVALNRN